MAIPLSYNVRNLAVRKTTTAMTALGIALTVAVLLAAFALVDGLRTAFEGSGHPLHILVTRKGSDSELSSNFQRSVFNDLKFKQGIAKNKAGEPLASLEMVTVINLASKEFPEGTNVTVRGITEIGKDIREDQQLTAGRWFTPGRREVTVGSSIAKRYPDAELGKKLKFGRGEWEVVGVFHSPQMARNSEILSDLNQAASDFQRIEVLSSALIRATDEVALQALINDLSYDTRPECHGPQREGILRQADVIGRFDPLSGDLRGVDHGGWFVLCGHEHDVRGRGAAVQGDWHFARAGLLAVQHHVELPGGVVAAVGAGRIAGHFAGLALEWDLDRNRQQHDVRGDSVPTPGFAGNHGEGVDVRAVHGSGRRPAARL